MRVKNVLIHIIVAGCLIMCSSPSAPDVPPNPFDTEHPDFVWPETIIIEGPESGEVIDQPQVTFKWSGSESVQDYSFRLEGSYDDNWSDWTNTTSVTYDYLDEQGYIFAVRSRHENGKIVEEDYPEVAFEVDAVKGPAVIFYPRKKILYGTSDVFYDIHAEEVNALLGAKIVLTYDHTRLNVLNVEKGGHLSSHDGSGVLFDDIDNNEGTVIIELTITGGEPKGISGSGQIAKLHLEPLKSGTTSIEMDPERTEYRDVENNTIDINEIVGGRLEIRD